ncbi:MAG: DUF3108 domain-containing protein [Pontiellaceae bacterium]|nr:DUF3108 domain-containing protein [Pontiellaceae bacterium]MBN2784980.1 DUF3108 domain-containing protein [Pontiellaceae bacterium]
MKRRSFIGALMTMPILNRLALGADEEEKPQLTAIRPGEKLRYSLGWQFVVAGHAITEVLPDTIVDGRTVRNFRMTAKTTKAIDLVYKVRDTLTSSAEYDVHRSLGYKKRQREGDTQRDETVDFDWQKNEAYYHEAISDKKQTTPVLENTLDPLSAFYFVRNQKFEVGSVIKGPLTDGKRCKIAEIRVVRREKIKVNGKRYDTYKLIPDIKDVGGVFKKSDDAKIEIWVTADYTHTPVLMKSKVAVGSFRAELEH